MGGWRRTPLSGIVAAAALIFGAPPLLFAAYADADPPLALGAAALGILAFVWSLAAFRAARHLEESRERLRLVWESVAEGIVTVDARGIVRHANDRAAALFGCRPGQLRDMRLATLFSAAHLDAPDDAELPVFLRINGLLPLGKPREATGLRADGRVFPMDVTVTRAPDGTGDLYVVSLRDATERAQARAALAGAQADLERRVRERTLALEEANARLHAEIAERGRVHAERERLIAELRGAAEEIQTLGGLLPICAACKKIRDDKGYWNLLEVYIRDHSEAEFSHGICPECMDRLYPGVAREKGVEDTGSASQGK